MMIQPITDHFNYMVESHCAGRFMDQQNRQDLTAALSLLHYHLKGRKPRYCLKFFYHRLTIAGLKYWHGILALAAFVDANPDYYVGVGHTSSGRQEMWLVRRIKAVAA